MCGIIGTLGFHNAYEEIINGLKLLEYRGYDSVGLALCNNNKIDIYKKAGRTDDLKEVLKDKTFDATCGIGHTRWATHGKVNDQNAHPFQVGKVTLVHNGIIENYKELTLKYQLNDLSSATDSEVVASLMNHFYEGDPLKTIQKVTELLQGTYALVILFEDHPNTIYATRHISPLVFSKENDAFMISSETLPLSMFTEKYCVLEDGYILEDTKDGLKVYDHSLQETSIKYEEITEKSNYELNGYDTYLDKEIHEQPAILTRCLNQYAQDDLPSFELDDAYFKTINKIYLVACGTSYHASLVIQKYIEEIANIPCFVEVASEFIYQKHFIDDKTLVIGISQSGETIDTIEACKYGKKYGAKLLALVNIENSELVHISDYHLLLLAGRELSVASTKAYTSQLLVLKLFTYYLAMIKETMPLEEIKASIKDLYNLSDVIEKIFKQESDIRALAETMLQKQIFMIGRGNDYTCLKEAALKIKELAYINVNAYLGGEIKHGPIALVDSNSVVIGLSLNSTLNSKILNNLKECESRQADIILVTSKALDHNGFKKCIFLPEASEQVLEIASIVAFQLLAKNFALDLERDVDKPRNLAKVVTVE